MDLLCECVYIDQVYEDRICSDASLMVRRASWNLGLSSSGLNLLDEVLAASASILEFFFNLEHEGLLVLSLLKFVVLEFHLNSFVVISGLLQS